MHTAAPSMTRPVRTVVGVDYGFACDPANHVVGPDGRPPFAHRGCPGWWPVVGKTEIDGWLCPCDCHEQGAGWPGAPLTS
jgi:hypothetical protein